MSIAEEPSFNFKPKTESITNSGRKPYPTTKAKTIEKGKTAVVDTLVAEGRNVWSGKTKEGYNIRVHRDNNQLRMQVVMPSGYVLHDRNAYYINPCLDTVEFFKDLLEDKFGFSFIKTT